MHNRAREASLRFAERRRREDEAPRLREEIPPLKTLRLEVEERRAGSAVSETKHVRLVVVDRAPALFELPCGDSDCRDGGHDLTRQLMGWLNDHATEFVVEDACSGNVRGVPCGRIVRVLGVATYASDGK
jgi:hypothetical protein